MDTKLKELIINEVTEEKLKELEDANAIPPNELFVTEDEDEALIIDEVLDANSENPITNAAVAQKFIEVDNKFTEITPSTTFAEAERKKSKNLFNKYTNLNRIFGWSSGATVLQSDGTIKATANFNNGLGKGAVVYLKPNTQYCLSFQQVGFEDPNRNGNIRVSAVNNEETSYTEIKSIRIWSDATSYSIPFITTDTGIIHISFGGSQNASDVNSFKYILYDDVQIEEGAVATDYQPYGGGPITHNGDAPVVFAEQERQKSKNLLKLNHGSYQAYSTSTAVVIGNILKLRSKYGITLSINYNDTNGQLKFSKSNLDAQAVVWFFGLKPNTSYTFSFNLYQAPLKGLAAFCGVDLDTTSQTGVRYSYSFVTSNSGEFNERSIWMHGNSVDESVIFSDLMLEEGDVATDYQPYNGAIVHEKDIDRTKLIYDGLSTSSKLNLGYYGGIERGGYVQADFSKYKRLILTCKWGDNAYGQFLVDLTCPHKDGSYQIGICNTSIGVADTDLYYIIGAVTADKTALNFEDGGYNTFSERFNIGGDTGLVAYILKIEGVY
jgi:hypothetical protein